VRHAIEAYESKQDSLKLYKPEKARAHFRLSRALRQLGCEEEAQEELSQAFWLFQELKPGNHRTAEMLEDKDFEKIVVFWSR